MISSSQSVDLLIIRHGQTLENILNVCQGQTRGVLSPLGISQAQDLSLSLAGMHFDAVICSDLERAQRTAELIFGAHKGLQILPDPRLRERSFGALEGLPLPAHLHFDDEIDGAESIESLRCRVQDFLTQLRSDYAGRRLAIVSHGVVIL